MNEYSDSNIGGAERQQLKLANLLKKNHSISFIVQDLGQEDVIFKDGFQLIKTYSPKKGIRFIRFLYPRFYKIWKGLKKADADIYYQRAAGVLTGIVALFCCINKKKMIYSVASNREFDKIDNIFSYVIEKYLYKFGIKKATKVILQSYYQKRRLKEIYKIGNSCVIPNIYDGPFLKGDSCPKKKYILNVSNFYPKKGHRELFELVKMIPGVQIKLIGGGNGDYYNNTLKLTKTLMNVEYLGRLIPEKTFEAYKNAFLLLNMSQIEGFPNVFLEAWANKIPVVSYKFDPDSIIEKKRMGLVGKSPNELKDHIKKLIDNEELRNSLGQNGYNYVKKSHSPDVIIKKYNELFESI